MEQLSELALNYIRNTGVNLFLTGKAGTGKTTFLRELKGLSPKRMVVVAPTGVAAMNAGGVTIHSFFQIPFGPYLPAKEGEGGRPDFSFSHKFGREKVNVIRSMDLLVIDEISMVRADLLDAVSDVLRRFRDKTKPFGGVQLLLIGDLRQLSPVAKEDEWLLLKDYYPSPYFFDSKALADTSYLCVELTHVYRQSDDRFLSLLNRIRDNRPDAETLRLLNERYRPGFTPDDREGFITLTTHNYQAQRINDRELVKLPGDTFTFEAEVEGDFPAFIYPADERLALKEGAQVMFVKNDSSPGKLYFNGKIGRIVSIGPQKIVVRDEAGENIPVNRETWQNMKYTIDEETKAIRETAIGSFVQYPLKTAWAITIHKSQGLTFERVIIDAAQSFSHGQVYVALSRCKTLEGVVLSSALTQSALVNDELVEQYSSSLSRIQAKEEALHEAERQYFLRLATELFDFEGIRQRLQYAAYIAYSRLSNIYPEWVSLFTTSRDSFRTEVTEVAERFRQQLRRLITETPAYAGDALIDERIRKGAGYFLGYVEACSDKLLKASRLDIDNKETKKQIARAVDALRNEFQIKLATLRASREGFSVSAYLSAKATAQIDDPAPAKGKRETTRPAPTAPPDLSGDAPSIGVRHPELSAALKKWRYEKASQKGLPPYTILQQKALLGISNLLPQNEKQLLEIPGIGKKVLENYGEDLLSVIRDYMAEHERNP
jgi:hypothetical protein